jgi:hypothetical protein
MGSPEVVRDSDLGHRRQISRGLIRIEYFRNQDLDKQKLSGIIISVNCSMPWFRIENQY